MPIDNKTSDIKAEVTDSVKVENIFDDIASVAAVATLLPLVLTNYHKYKLFLVVQKPSKPLPSSVIALARSKYNIDLEAVRYHENVNTLHGFAITLENDIFFPKSVDMGNRADLFMMLHELTHVEQYKKMGLIGFLTTYVSQAVSAIPSHLAKGFVNIHDAIPLEREADAKALTVYPNLMMDSAKEAKTDATIFSGLSTKPADKIVDESATLLPRPKL